MPIPHTLAAHYRNMPINRVLLYQSIDVRTKISEHSGRLLCGQYLARCGASRRVVARPLWPHTGPGPAARGSSARFLDISTLHQHCHTPCLAPAHPGRQPGLAVGRPVAGFPRGGGAAAATRNVLPIPTIIYSI